MRRLVTILMLLAAGAGCSRPSATSTLVHDVYVWQRFWSPEVGKAVADAPGEIGALHVLAREWAGTPRAASDVAVDVVALAAAGRAVVAVMRIEGTAPLDTVTLDDTVALAGSWQKQGVHVVGIEIDHDCASAHLSAYVEWLGRARASLRGFPLILTALPSWLASPVLPRLLAAVDEVVVQVHTIAAPALFDEGVARRQLEMWSRVSMRDFRVALPTYRARLKDGRRLAAEPRVLACFLADLQARPIRGLRGVVWFRLGHRADPDAWSASTLATVVHGKDLDPHLTARLVTSGSGALDVVVENMGAVDAEAPRRLEISGAWEVLDGVQGFFPHGSTLATATPPHLRAGDSLVVGFVRGKEIHVRIP